MALFTRKLRITILLALGIAACTQPQTATDTMGGRSAELSVTLVLVNGSLIDGSGGEPISDAVVVIDAERIVAVGARSQIEIPKDAPIIDVAGAAILPGFINTHVHSAYDEDKLAAWAQDGVTTVRDLGNDSDPQILIAFRNSASQDPRFARLVAAGPLLTTIGGYGTRQVGSVAEARDAVSELLNAGVDLIKVGIEDNLQGRTWPMLSVEEITAIVERAHSGNFPVSAHVSRGDHVEIALQAGVDDVAHMVVDEISDDLVERMIAAYIYWVPTLELWACVDDLHPVHYGDQAVQNLTRFSQAGGLIALGTDCTGYRCVFDLGMPMTEIELMRQAGMTPMEIIVAATKNAAHVCNLESDLGTLEAGKIADILVVDGNPLEDLSVLQNISMVIHNGVIIRE
jgi:imidazolonepropionase-like amidohydrolase